MYKRYNDFPELKDKIINYIEEIDKEIWLATSNGLYVLDPDQGITDYYEPMPNLNVQHFYKEDSTFWVATYGDGLIRWNKNTDITQQYSKGQRLKDDQMMAVYPDKKGFLWLSSNYGLARFSTATEQFRLFTESDGISHMEFNRGSHFQDETGRIYFGGLNGVTAFQPEDIPNDTIRKYPLKVTAYHETNRKTGDLDDKTTC